MMYGQILQALLDVVQYAQPGGDGSSYNGPSLAKEKDGNAGCKYYGEGTTAHHISWGPIWCCSSMMIHCDNATAVTVINSGVLQIMHRLRCLFFIRAHFQMSLHAVHTPGHLNTVTDAISHNNLPHFFKQVPAASHIPDRILPELLDLLQPGQDCSTVVFIRSSTINPPLLPIWISSELTILPCI